MGTARVLLGLIVVGAPPLWGQQLSGEGTCGKPEVAHLIPVGDRPNHSFSIARNRCTWTRPFEIAGERAEGGTGVQFDERDGNTSRFHGHYFDRMSSGDTVHYRYQGVTNWKGDTPENVNWKWTFTGNTGKLTGLRGQGTCKGSMVEGTYRWRCSGAYRIRR